MNNEFKQIKQRFDQTFGTRDTDEDMQWLINEVERLQSQIKQVKIHFSAMPYSIGDVIPDWDAEEESK